MNASLNAAGITLQVGSMTCASCVGRVEKASKALPTLSVATLAQAVVKAGYAATVEAPKENP